jgi:hypothetical protein
MLHGSGSSTLNFSQVSVVVLVHHAAVLIRVSKQNETKKMQKKQNETKKM